MSAAPASGRSLHPLLAIVASFVMTAGVLALHFMWTYLPLSASWRPPAGVAMILALFLAAYLPLILYVRGAASAAPAPAIPRMRVVLACVGIAILAVAAWALLARHGARFPVHTLGDEGFHIPRVAREAEFLESLLRHVAGQDEAIKRSPPHFIQYPPLAYFAHYLLARATFQGFEPEAQRGLLVVFHAAFAVAAFAMAISVLRRLGPALLVGAIVALSPLYLAYTMSFYIEIQYAAVVVWAAWLLYAGTRDRSAVHLCAAAAVASVAPIVRDSMFPTALAIGAGAGVALALLMRENARPGRMQAILRVVAPLNLVALALLPWLFYYVGKNAFTSFDRSRIGFENITRQDWAGLGLYSLLYLGAGVIVLALLGLWRGPRERWITAWTMLAAVLGQLAIYALLDPRYMPWTRNYLMIYPQVIVIAILGTGLSIGRGGKVRAATIALLAASVAANAAIGATLLQHNRFFHESETILDYTQLRGTLECAQPPCKVNRIYLNGFMGTIPPALEAVVPRKNLMTMTAPQIWAFAEFEKSLPAEAEHVLFHWYRNVSRPRVLRVLPAADPPGVDQLRRYEILHRWEDPFSDGRMGYVFLRRKAS